MSTNYVSYRDLSNLAYCATGAAINRASNSEEIRQLLLFGGSFMALPVACKAGKGLIWDTPKWLWNNKGNYGPAFQNVWGNSFGQVNIFNPSNRSALKGHFLETAEKTYKDGQRAIKQAEKAKAIQKIKHNRQVAAGNVQATSKWGKVASAVKTKTGLRKVETKILEGTLSTNKAVRVLSKGAKAGGGMAVISAALEAPTVVKTYKKYGAKRGTKQLGKSAVNVAAETAGYVVGAKLGGIAGAKLGAVIGTCIGGPIGTAVGGAIGTIVGVGCGLLGSWLAGKASRAIVGEDELTIAQKEEADELARAAKKDENVRMQLVAQSIENLENGEVASEKDTLDITRSLNNVIRAEMAAQEATETAATPTISTPVTTTQQRPTLIRDEGFLALTALAARAQ